MRLLEELQYYSWTLDPALKYLLFFILSDPHRGNPLFDEEAFLHQIDYIYKTPEAYFTFNGDLNESTLRTSKGEIYKQVGSPADQRDWMIEKTYRVKHKLLGMDTGNHEDRVYQETGLDISKDIADALGVPYDPYGIYLKISFGDHCKSVKGKPFTYWIYCTHGYGGARTKAAKAVKVERVATWLHADVYGMSHDHVVNIAPDIYLIPDPRDHPQKDKNNRLTGFTVGRVRQHRKMLIKTNAFLKWGGYARRDGFPPTDLITPTIILGGQIKPWFNSRDNYKPEVRVIT